MSLTKPIAGWLLLALSAMAAPCVHGQTTAERPTAEQRSLPTYAIPPTLGEAQRSPRVDVYVTDQMPVTNARGARVWIVNARQRLEQELSADLPSDPKAAAVEVNRRIRAMGPEHGRRVQAMIKTQMAALRSGIKKVPAVVFGNSWAVYGITDVDLAKRYLKEGRAQQLAHPIFYGKDPRD